MVEKRLLQEIDRSNSTERVRNDKRVEEENRKAIRSCLFVSNDRLRSKTGVRARILNGSAIAKKNNGQSTTTSIKRDCRC